MTKNVKDLITSQHSLGRLFNVSRFDDLFNELNKMVDYAWNDLDLDANAFCSLQPKTKFPKINVSETDSAYEVEIAVSGIDKDNLSLEFKDPCLLIKADKVKEQEDSNKKWLTREISSRSFRRTLQFPTTIDSESISSNYDESKGLVVCVLPKKKKINPETVKIKIK